MNEDTRKRIERLKKHSEEMKKHPAYVEIPDDAPLAGLFSVDDPETHEKYREG